MTEITLLDGGMGQELLARAGGAPTPLWATRVMLDHPGLVQQIHAAYFAAGASIATTNSYALHRDRLTSFALEHRLPDLIAQALAEAQAARADHGSGRIAGAIGPLVATYRPELHPVHDTAVPLYAEIAGMLSPGVDLLLAESVASLAHARALTAGAGPVAQRAGLPLWLSVTVEDRDGTRLRSGEPVAALAGQLDGVAAILANCSAPEAMDQAMPILASFGLPCGAYANGFQQITSDFLKDKPTVDALSARPEMTPARYADFALGWVAAGATIIGGCCETGPAHIAALTDRLRAAGHRIA